MAGAGTDLGFPAGEFRDAIRAAMVMGSPNRTLDKATFRWDKVRHYDPQSPAGEPYSWASVPDEDLSRADVVLDEVAVEYAAGRTIEGTTVGQFVPLRAELTMLDVDRDLVVGANWVLLHGIPWAIAAETVTALFSVDVYTLYVERQ